MLLRRDAKYLDKVTNRYERVFPTGTDWLTFRSQLPVPEVFANSVLDPAIGIGGELGVRAFAAADWRNWTSAIKIGLFELSTRVGLPPLENQSLNQSLAVVFDMLKLSADAFRHSDNAAEIVPELIQNAGMQVIMTVLQIAGASNPITFVVTQVIQIATWAVSIARAAVQEELGKNISFPPLQTEDPATDTWQVSRVLEVFRARGSGGVVFPDGQIEPASNANYTSLYLPAYRTHMKWQIQYREQGIAAQHGYASNASGISGDVKFDPGDASSFGFMPGTTVMLRVLQASWRLYGTTRATPVDRYSLRCRGVDKPCWKTVKTFDGSRDCRQCVDAQFVWPVGTIAAHYGGAPLNATTPGENTGAFFPTANKLLANLLDMITQPGPLLYTLDAILIREQWKKSFERFWEFTREQWRQYNGSGWRGLISRIATLMTAFEHDGQVILGGREMYMPLTHIANPREANFEVPFKYSIYRKIIEPFCNALYMAQVHYLDTFQVAMIPPGAGAIYDGNGKIKKSPLGDAFLSARRNLLNANKRMLVDLRQVSDPEYRAELEQSGVKVSPVNQRLSGPGITGNEVLDPDIKPRRAPPRPKVARVSPFAGAVKLIEATPVQPPKPRAKKKRRVLVPKPKVESKPKDSTAGVVIGVTAAVVAVTAATILTRNRDDEKTR